MKLKKMVDWEPKEGDVFQYFRDGGLKGGNLVMFSHFENLISGFLGALHLL